MKAIHERNGALQEGQIDHAGIENLPELFSRLSEQVVKLFETKVQLLKAEIRDDVNNYIRNGIIFGIGAVLLIVGFVLFNIAIGFLLATFFAFPEQTLNYVFGFLSIGIFYLIVGGIITAVIKSRLAAIDPLPERSIKELRKDKQWLTKEL